MGQGRFCPARCTGTKFHNCSVNIKNPSSCSARKGRLFVALPPFFTGYSHNRTQSDICQCLSTVTGGTRRSLLFYIYTNRSFSCSLRQSTLVKNRLRFALRTIKIALSIGKIKNFGAQLGDVFMKSSACASHQPAALCRCVLFTTCSLHCLCVS